MFALGSVQPQLVVPLGHLASAWNVLRSASHSVARGAPARSTQQNVTAASMMDDPGPMSIHEMTSGIRDTLHELGFHHLAKDVRIETLNPLVQPKLQAAPPTYTSGDSFFFNKHGFPEDRLLSATYQRMSDIKITLPLSSSHPRQRHWIPASFRQQTRGFKTKRSKGSGVGGAAESFGSASKGSTVLGSITPQKIPADAATQDRLKQLLSDVSGPDTNPDKMKIAFAEGFVAGQDQHKGGVSDNWSKRLYKLVAVMIVMFSIYYVAFPLFVALYSKSSRLNNIFADTGYLVKAEEVEERFADVKGADEAKEELRDVVEFLGNPDKFTALGAKLPKGVLLCGPPGIGKTLLARAVAGEAGVPFIYASGSEFDEIFVGVGAKKIRDLFADAKNRTPCVIFLDEIDAVGSKRVNSETHPYANQTINQLLTEMDGFKQNEGIIVLGATNRRDNLDKALMRPGRFDVEVHMQPPDYKGRIEIFQLYLNKVKAAEKIDLDRLARATSGYTGADIANVVNQAAIAAALRNNDIVTLEDLEFARDKITMGPMRKTRIPCEETNKVTAYHEAGHTLVAFYTKAATAPHKVTIMPRGQSLGHTAFIPEKDRYNLTKMQLLAEMDVALGGRVAEELIFGADQITTGAGSDFQKANSVAEALVKKLGMSEKAGFRVIEDKDFLHGQNPEYSAATMEVVDTEIKRLLQESYERCRVLLKGHQYELKQLADALYKYETLDKDEIKTILDGKKLVKTHVTSTEKAKNVPAPGSKKAIQAIIDGTKLPTPPNTAARTDTRQNPSS